MARTHLIQAAAMLLTCFRLAAAQDYPVQLNRPNAVGERYILTSSFTRDSTVQTTIDGTAGPTTRRTVMYAICASADVLAVAPDGEKSQCRYTVLSSSASSGVGSAELVAAGTVILATYEDPIISLLIDGRKPDPALEKKLNKVLDTGRANGRQEQRMFGTELAKKPGDQWGISPQATMENLNKSPLFDLDLSRISGSTTFDAVQTMSGQAVMKLSSTMDLENYGNPAPHSGIARISSSMRSSYAWVLPIDVTKRQLLFSYSIETKLVDVSTGPGPHVQSSVDALSQCVKSTRTSP